MRRYARKDAGPQRRVNWGVLRRLEKGTSASENAGPRREVDCEILHRLRKRTKHFL